MHGNIELNFLEGKIIKLRVSLGETEMALIFVKTTIHFFYSYAIWRMPTGTHISITALQKSARESDKFYDTQINDVTL